MRANAARTPSKVPRPRLQAAMNSEEPPNQHTSRPQLQIAAKSREFPAPTELHIAWRPPKDIEKEQANKTVPVFRGKLDRLHDPLPRTGSSSPAGRHRPQESASTILRRADDADASRLKRSVLPSGTPSTASHQQPWHPALGKHSV